MVEWKKMWEVTTWDKKFNGIDKSMQPTIIKYHYYLANELSEIESSNGSVRILYTTDKVAFTDEEKVKENISEGEVVTIPWGGNVSIKYFKGRFVTADNRIATSNDVQKLSNKFLFYWMLQNKEVIGSFYRGAGIKHPSMMLVLNMDIPIPSLSEQNRIVNILDTFTSAIDNLKLQIAQRKKQYEYYRNQILDLEGIEGCSMKQIGDICEIIRGNGVQKTDFVEEGIGCIHYGQIYTHYGLFTKTTNKYVSKEVFEKARKASKGDVVMTATSENVDDICKSVAYLGEEDIAVSAHAFIVKPKKHIDSKYLAYCTTTYNFYKQKYKLAHGAKVVEIKPEKLALIKIPVIAYPAQMLVVFMLDKFEASISNLQKQLELRQKQYEYYRNRLLTFE